jgi:hypothetical protein
MERRRTLRSRHRGPIRTGVRWRVGRKVAGLCLRSLSLSGTSFAGADTELDDYVHIWTLPLWLLNRVRGRHFKQGFN